MFPGKNREDRASGRTLSAILLACLVSIAGCGGSEVTEQADTAETEAPAEMTAAFVNPNLAGGDELGMLPGMTAELADQVLAGRPFSGMIELDALIAQHMNREDSAMLYARMFIPLNLNTATEEEMRLVPGVGDRMVHEFEEYRPYLAIAQWRREMGKYVDDAEVARMEQYVFVPIDLNTATDEEILAVPGVGDRMTREFKEYRPYSSIEQFRREIGKYVDDGEVARLERYVEIRSQDP